MQANINHKVDNKLGKKKVRRGGRRRNLYKYFSSNEYYQCHNKGYLVKSSPKDNNPKPSSIHEDYLLRKVGNGTMKATIANHSLVHEKAIWVPKHVVTNMRGPNTDWVPSTN